MPAVAPSGFEGYGGLQGFGFGFLSRFRLCVGPGMYMACTVAGLRVYVFVFPHPLIIDLRTWCHGMIRISRWAGLRIMLPNNDRHPLHNDKLFARFTSNGPAAVYETHASQFEPMSS